MLCNISLMLYWPWNLVSLFFISRKMYSSLAQNRENIWIYLSNQGELNFLVSKPKPATSHFHRPCHPLTLSLGLKNSSWLPVIWLYIRYHNSFHKVLHLLTYLPQYYNFIRINLILVNYNNFSQINLKLYCYILFLDHTTLSRYHIVVFTRVESTGLLRHHSFRSQDKLLAKKKKVTM